MATTKGPREDFLPSTGLCEELGLWYQQWALAPIHLLEECRWIWVRLSCFSNLPYWLRFWVLFGHGAAYLPSPSRKDTGGRWNIQGILTHGLDIKWGLVERYQEIPTLAKDEIFSKILAEICQNCPPSGKVLGRGARLEKNLRNTQGLAERCWGCFVVGDCMVLAEWLTKRLIWHFSSIWLPL